MLAQKEEEEEKLNEERRLRREEAAQRWSKLEKDVEAAKESRTLQDLLAEEKTVEELLMDDD